MICQELTDKAYNLMFGNLKKKKNACMIFLEYVFKKTLFSCLTSRVFKTYNRVLECTAAIQEMAQ